MSASSRDARSIATFSRKVSVSRAITASSEAAARNTASALRWANAAKTSNRSPARPNKSGTATSRRLSPAGSRRTLGTRWYAAAAMPSSPAHQPVSIGPPDTNVPSAVRTRYSVSASQKVVTPIASSIHVRSRRQPVPASAPTISPSSTRSPSGYARFVATASALPSTLSSTAWNPIAALSEETASAAISPSTHSVRGTALARERSNSAMPASTSGGKSR